MSTVLKLWAQKRAQQPRARRPVTGEMATVVIFPGIRIERHGEAENRASMGGSELMLEGGVPPARH